MALHEVELDSNIVDVAFDRTGTSFAVLSRQDVKLYSLQYFENQGAQPTVFPLQQNLGTPVQLAFKDDGELFILCHYRDRNEDRIYRVMAGEMFQQKDENIAMLISGREGHDLYVQNVWGKIRVVRDTLHYERTVVDLPIICPWVEVVEVKGTDIVFGLTASGQLFANQRRLVSNCTSFLTTSAHLIFTTSNHLLKFVHLTNVDELEVPCDEPETDERCRSIERGARLVTVIPSAYSLVLQMPRGNLETIYPRALVLAGIRRSISNKDYKKAFLACRGHRVDTNILYDYAPQQFLENVELFVKQIKKAEYIDLFLSQLREEDTSMTLYKETLTETTSIAKGSTELNGHVTPSPVQSIANRGSKVNKLCDAFLKVLSSKMETNLQNIITAHVCKSPPDLEGGLQIIAQLRGQAEELAEKAAEHICFLADTNQLYDYALGMYDLELTILIAQQSQKDPREYLPYLQGLQEMIPFRRQFTIDNDLGRKEKALQHLFALDAFDELSRYAEKYELHAAAIELCKYQPDRLNALMRLYADFLNSRNRFKEAAVAYEFLHDYSSAIPAYRSAILWREALSCASLLPLSPNDLTSLARDLAETLAESKDYQAAATIQFEYLTDIESAARLYCKAYLFADAMRIVSLHGKPELLETVIDPGIIDSFSSTSELLADCKSQLAAQVPRLQELRVKKEQDPLAFYGGEPADAADGDIPDDISLAPTDASTMGTFMTRYTARTTGTLNSNVSRKSSKNRRREERKRAKGKKGSVYEEEYLISSIGRLIERINSVRDEVQRLVEALMRRGMREQALVVENAMVEVVERCKQILPEVFQCDENRRANAQQPLGKTNGTDRLLQVAMEKSNIVQAPIVKEFERLSLLG
jgi:elongator complex protein 1